MEAVPTLALSVILGGVRRPEHRDGRDRVGAYLRLPGCGDPGASTIPRARHPNLVAADF